MSLEQQFEAFDLHNRVIRLTHENPDTTIKGESASSYYHGKQLISGKKPKAPTQNTDLMKILGQYERSNQQHIWNELINSDQ